MRSLWRWVRGRGKRGLGRPYEPSTRLPRETMEVSGTWLMRASANYHEATLGWMMGVGLYRQIRLDREDHLLRLISVDRGTIANRAKGHRPEPVYRVAMRIWVGVEPILTEWAMFDVLSSDFDAIAPSGQGGWVMGGKELGTVGMAGTVKSKPPACEGELWTFAGTSLSGDVMYVGKLPDAHGRIGGCDRG